MKEFVLLYAAEVDIQKAFELYENKKEFLGEEFPKHIEYGLTLIRNHPEIAPVYLGRHRRWTTHKFPFGIFYVVYPARIVVSGIMDLRQNPTLFAPGWNKMQGLSAGEGMKK